MSMDRLKSLCITVCFAALLQSGHVQRVIDGDTFVLYHVGTPPEERVRVLDTDTPERGEPLYAEARTFTQHWLSLGSFDVIACKRDSFGRLLGNVSRDGEVLAEELKKHGLSK